MNVLKFKITKVYYIYKSYLPCVKFFTSFDLKSFDNQNYNEQKHKYIWNDEAQNTQQYW